MRAEKDHLVDAVDHRRVGGGLVAALAAVPDPRKRRGIRHQLAAVGVGFAPCESAIRRTLQRLDGDELDAAIGSWAAGHAEPTGTGRRLVAVDGKRVRGSGGGTTDARHLLGAIDHTHGVVLAQREVGCKTNEITEFAPLLDTIDLSGAVVTADAMHAQRAHADYLVLQRGAHYLVTVKSNQPVLHDQLKALPWKDVPIAHTSHDRAHGRVERRSVKIVPVSTGILFPHARQAIQITRKTRGLKNKKWTTEVAYAVTRLTRVPQFVGTRA